VEASSIRGDGGHHRAGDARTEVEALTGRSSVQHNGRKANRRGHASNRVVRRAVWTLILGPLTTPINRPPGDSPRGEPSAFITICRIANTFVFLAPSSFDNLPSHLSRVQGHVAIGYLIPAFGTHRVLSPKTNLTMPPRRVSQCLHPDEGLPQTSDQNQPHSNNHSLKPTPPSPKL
jgi:hypothetical protein